jgi:hypothetical protein
MALKKSFWSKRKIALLWTAALFAVIFTLLRYEQIALIYVLATLGLVALLLIVSFSDLEKVGRDSIES